MISLHLKDGKTIPIDLDDSENEYLKRLELPDFQELITAITIQMKHPTRHGEQGVRYSVVRPKGFSEAPWFKIEKVPEQGKVRGGERLEVTVAGITIALMAHGSEPAARISVVQKKRKAEEGDERQE